MHSLNSTVYQYHYSGFTTAADRKVIKRRGRRGSMWSEGRKRPVNTTTFDKTEVYDSSLPFKAQNIILKEILLSCVYRII